MFIEKDQSIYTSPNGKQVCLNIDRKWNVPTNKIVGYSVWWRSTDQNEWRFLKKFNPKSKHKHQKFFKEACDALNYFLY